uniref:C-type lectin domain-containing protein n=1 Tax=Takifugu rubripes TaxID=31033 RepID=A0A3B5KAB2_TAKRU
QKSLSFRSLVLLEFCNRTTLDCSWCPPGWIDHDSRCYLALLETRTFVNAQEVCKRRYRGHLPIVLNAADQILLTNITNKLDEEYGVNGQPLLLGLGTKGTFSSIPGFSGHQIHSKW